MIRAFTHNDMDQVITIWLEASIQSHPFIDREFLESKTDEMREVYIPSSDTYVFASEGAVHGFVSLHQGTVAAIFVAPDMQRKGIGKKLMDKAKELHNNLTLTVYKNNPSSIEFYKSCGFTIVQEQTNPHTGHPELLMQFSS